MGGLHGQCDPLTDQTEWILDRIVELHPDAEAGFHPQIAVQTIQEALDALEGKFGATIFGLAHSCIDPNKIEQMITLLEDALEAWKAWHLEHADAPKDSIDGLLAKVRDGA